jgi:hypothetical protein
MAKYRFKRLDEYDASEKNSLHGIPTSWSLSMSIYMGADIPDEYNEYCDINISFQMCGWCFQANEYVKKEVVINNIVVENTSKEHGARIINHFKSFGIDTGDRKGLVYGNEPHRFYGVINGRFDNHNLSKVQNYGAAIIKLPEDVKDEKQDDNEYFDDLSQHVGRYLKALVDYPAYGGVISGEIGIIINSNTVDFPSQKYYRCTNALSKGILNVKYELMPEDYSPDLPSDEVYEYVKCIRPGGWVRTIKENFGNLIFKTSEFDLSRVTNIQYKDWKEILKTCPRSWIESTREEYLSQFITDQKDEQVQSIVEKVSSISYVHNHKTFIEPVHSVNLKLSTKNKSIKF